MLIKSTMLASAILLSASMYAQTNFSGNWNLKDKQYVTGPKYGNALSDKLNIIQTKDSLVVETFATGQDGVETKSRSAISMNGKVASSKSPSSGRKLDKSIKWSDDKKSMIVTTVIYKTGSDKDVELTRIDTYSITDDKKLKINRKSNETITESWEVIGTYEH